MKKIGLFYGPLGGSTEKVAKKVVAALGFDNVDLIPVKTAKAADVEKYENVVFGLSTIGKETWQADKSANDWDVFLPEIEKINFANKAIAMFGLGDQISYGNHFVDAMGIVGEKIMKNGGEIVGHVATEGYDFGESLAVIDGKFLGLPVNEDFEPELTDERVKKWVKVIKPLFK
ncbi:MAG: flavodoxin [Bacteroidetes bacterium GWF2_33_16]|nr:MAG: flavodoxin [Bacteroidetes bacterium GWE2_32_14]OFY06510.1 MAG: flavodoxin [Bacteroidetes bacterium GWF2_33_16]